ncbi:ABC transporter substrate-binding protein, partial [Thioclava sp. BHET1]
MFTRRRFVAGAAASGLVLAAPAVRARSLPGRIRMVIGSKSAGGDTYQNSAIVADALSRQLDASIKVDPVGASDAFRFLGRDTRGTTIMVFHDQAYLGYLYGQQGYEDPFTQFRIGPTVAINPGNAYLVPKKSPYRTMKDVFDAVAAGKRVRVAIQPGGVSEIGFSAMKNAASILKPGSEQNFAAVNTGSQSDKNQALFDGLADIINGSIQANEQFTELPESDQKAMRFIWLTARDETLQQAPEKGIGKTSRADLLQYAAPKTSVTLDGKTDFTFDKEFFFLYNKMLDAGMITEIDQALSAIYKAGEIEKRQKAAFFIPNFLPSDQALAHL